MSRHDHPTRHALAALRREAALTHPKSTDAAVFASQFQALAKERHAELAAARATIFEHPPLISLKDGKITIRRHLPDTNGHNDWDDFVRYDYLGRSVLDLPKTLADLLILKVHGRSRLAEIHCDRLFSALARLEAREVADKRRPAPSGWATLAERSELDEAAAPASQQRSAARI